MTATSALRAETTTVDGVTPFVHNLAGPVDIVGLDADGGRVGVIVNPITDNEAEVIDPSGLAVRLVATPAVAEE